MPARTLHLSTDAKGRVVDANSAARALGAEPDALLFEVMSDFASRACWTAFLARTRAAGGLLRSSLGDLVAEFGGALFFCSLHADSAAQRVDLVGVPVVDAKLVDRRPNLVIDVSDEDPNRTIVASDLHGNVLYVNGNVTEHYGYTVAELVGSNADAFSPGPEQIAQFREGNCAVRAGKCHSFTGPIVAKDGSEVVVHAELHPIFDDDGKTIVGCFSVCVPAALHKAPVAPSPKEGVDAAVQAILAELRELRNVNFVLVGGPGSSKPTEIIDCGSELLSCLSRPVIGEDITDVFGDPLVEDLPRWSGPPDADVTFTELQDCVAAIESGVDGRFILNSYTTPRDQKLCVTIDVKVLQGGAGVLVLIGRIPSEEKLVIALEKAHTEALANHYKTKFITKMSHELRTPIHGLMAETELLLELFSQEDSPHSNTGQDSREIVESLRVVQSCAQMQLSLVNNLLDLRSIQEGKFKPALDKMVLRATAENVVRVCAAMAQVKNTSISLRVEDARIADREIVSDERKIIEVVLNFVGNSVKYTPEGSAIDVVVRALDSATAAVLVMDNGSGVPEAHERDLFKPFSKIGDAVEGTGLGLSICREIADMLGGRVWYERRPEGGAVFAFSFPYKPVSEEVGVTDSGTTSVPAVAARVAPVDSKDVEQKLLPKKKKESPIKTLIRKITKQRKKVVTSSARASRDTEETRSCSPASTLVTEEPTSAEDSDGSATTMTDMTGEKAAAQKSEVNTSGETVIAPSAAATPAAAPPRILVAEDNKINQRVLVKMLNKVGVPSDCITVADNGREALERVQAGNEYSLILMDLSMPVMDGIEASRLIREHGCGAHIVAVTANALGHHRAEAERVGINEYLTKPIGLADLRTCLAKNVPAMSNSQAVDCA